MEFYGFKEVTEHDEMSMWIKSAHIDHFIIVHPKSLDTMIKADRTLSYDFISSMEPTKIVHENKEIPTFVFKYLVQENLSKFIEQALEKTY